MKVLLFSFIWWIFLFFLLESNIELIMSNILPLMLTFIDILLPQYLKRLCDILFENEKRREKTQKQRMNWKWIIYSQQFRQVRVLSFWHHRFTAVFNTQLKTTTAKRREKKKMEENRKTIQLHSGINDCSVRSMDSQNKTKMHRSKLKNKQTKKQKIASNS